MKVVNTIEAIIGLCGAIWIFLYYTGRLNYKGDKEKRRRKRVEKYGWVMLLGGFMCIIGATAIVVGTFWDF